MAERLEKRVLLTRHNFFATYFYHIICGFILLGSALLIEIKVNNILATFPARVNPISECIQLILIVLAGCF